MTLHLLMMNKLEIILEKQPELVTERMQLVALSSEHMIIQFDTQNRRNFLMFNSPVTSAKCHFFLSNQAYYFYFKILVIFIE